MLSTIAVALLLSCATPPELDPRVDPAKITTLPKPEVATVDDLVRADAPTPVHRIGDRAGAVPIDEANFARARASIARGLQFLTLKQSKRGTWFEGAEVEATDMEPRRRSASVAVTAMALKAFAQAGDLGNADARGRARAAIGATLADPRAMAAIESGGIGNYVMSSIASGLASVGDADALEGTRSAILWVSRNQWDEVEGIDSGKDWYGGAGYGNGKRPDLSNTQMMLDAMHDAGVSSDEPAVQRALAFVARTQNRKASNPSAWAQNGASDGGFVYSPANGGESFASDAAGEGRYGEKLEVKSLRSYGSMTYAGFKSMLYAGLSKDDPRVKDAMEWISRHFTLQENPGLGQQGYFYYIHAMARAMHASRTDAIVTEAGARREWRPELIEALVARQREDGSWKNTAKRWEESNEELATIYAVLALEEALKPAKQSQ